MRFMSVEDFLDTFSEEQSSSAMSGSVEDFLDTFSEENEPKEKAPKTGLDKYKLRETQFTNQLRVWRNDISKENPQNKDLLSYLKWAKTQREEVIKKEVKNHGAIKVTFGDLVNFERKRNGVMQTKRQWFHEQEPHFFTKANVHEFGEEYEKYIDWVMGQVTAWNKKD